MNVLERHRYRASVLDASKLFEPYPDIIGIKEAFEHRKLGWDVIKPYYDKIAENAKTLPKWDPEKRFADAVVVAAYLVAQDLKTNQVRKILDMARSIELKSRRGDNIKEDLIKMRFLLAYIAGKATGKSRYSLEAFHKVLDPIIAELIKEPSLENFEKFYEFLQAVVAYHKFFGGKD
ncbi:type III-A CRISPR-associated protein Csm2 [Palaeococcus sp. (in: euryarchaeotes)]